MTKFRTFLLALFAGLVLAGSLAAPASAAPDCHAIGQRHAAQAGGQLARATPETRNGQEVCVIVVLMPAKDGQRPRRNEIVVPAR